MRARRTSSGWKAWTALAAAFALALSPSGAAYAQFQEFQVKAAYLYKFAPFVDWPANAFPSPASPLVLCVAGEDPFGPMLDRAVADAARLLGADRAQINLIGESGTHLDPPITAAPAGPSPDDVIVPLGSGIAGTAAAERRVCWTGHYLDDQTFPHDEGDARIAAQDIHSMMSAPLAASASRMFAVTASAGSPAVT